MDLVESEFGVAFTCDIIALLHALCIIKVSSGIAMFQLWFQGISILCLAM